MTAVPPSGFPQRWDVPPLDPDTVEWIARLNEEERHNLIWVGNLAPAERENLMVWSRLSDEEREGLRELARLDKGVREAGIKLATRSAAWGRFTKRFPTLILLLASLITAGKIIWDTFGPWLKLITLGGRP